MFFLLIAMQNFSADHLTFGGVGEEHFVSARCFSPRKFIFIKIFQSPAKIKWPSRYHFICCVILN